MSTSPTLLDPDTIVTQQALAQQLLDGLNSVLFGQEKLTRSVLVGLLAHGHVLLEGLPGLGKTELIKALGQLSGLSFRRIQFTPDLLPSDITGTQIIDQDNAGNRELRFREGPLFSQLVLADEINRASPKTQAALLEAMAERTVSTFEETRALPRPFFVLATQNPIEQDGTYPLPEAQLDRFLIKLVVQGVETDALERMLTQRPTGQTPALSALTNSSGIKELLANVNQIALPSAVANYIARLVNSTRPECNEASDFCKQHVRWGASPRAAIALANCARACALLDGRPAAGFADVQEFAAEVLGHRIVRNYESQLQGISDHDLIQHIVTNCSELGA